MSETTQSTAVQTHWKKLYNPDYLGAYSLEPGKDIILTIANVKNEIIMGTDGKKEECMVMRFSNNEKPMIINATNAKTITKLLQTPYIENWSGHRIQIFADKVKAFGDVVEALRIRPTLPKPINVAKSCEECGEEIKAFGAMSAEKMAIYTTQQYKKALCADCATKLKNAKESDNNA